MATLEDVAAELVARLRELESEIDESGRKIEDLREGAESVGREVDQEWKSFEEKLFEFMQKFIEKQQKELDAKAQEAFNDLGEAQQAVATSGASARTEVAQGSAQLEALRDHATALEPAVESLVADGGEAPARSLVERAHELEQELVRLTDEASNFLRDEVVPGVEGLATDVREACQALKQTLEDQVTTELQASFDDWQSKVDELEDYVGTQGFMASHTHALAVVEWAVEQCRVACQDHLDKLDGVLDAAIRPLQALAADVERAGDTLVAGATDLLRGLDGTRDTARDTRAALGRVRELLNAYSFLAV